MSLRGCKQRRDQFAMSFDEIGAELGLTGYAVELIYNRAIEKLAKRKPDGLQPSLAEHLEEPKFQPPTPRVQFGERTRSQPDETRAYEYQDWSPETTVVVSGPIGSAKFPGRRFNTRSEAREYWQHRGIVEEYPIEGRYIFRVKKHNGATGITVSSTSSDGGEVADR